MGRALLGLNPFRHGQRELFTLFELHLGLLVEVISGQEIV